MIFSYRDVFRRESGRSSPPRVVSINANMVVTELLLVKPKKPIIYGQSN